MDVGRGGVCTAAEAEVAVATSSLPHMFAAAGTAAVATAGRPTGIDYCCLLRSPKGASPCIYALLHSLLSLPNLEPVRDTPER